MTEDKKWCTLCKIFICNNSSTLRRHERSLRHKDNLTNKDDFTKTKRLSNITKEKVGNDKEKTRLLTQIKSSLRNCWQKASLGHQKDTSTIEEARDSYANSLGAQASSKEEDEVSTMFADWARDMSTGYYYNLINGCFYDPNSGLYFTHDLGKWVTLKEVVDAVPKLPSGTTLKKPNFPMPSLTSKSQPPTPSANMPSSLHKNKSKRSGSKSKAVSQEEAREAERKTDKSDILPIRFTYARKKRKD